MSIVYPHQEVKSKNGLYTVICDYDAPQYDYFIYKLHPGSEITNAKTLRSDHTPLWEFNLPREKDTRFTLRAVSNNGKEILACGVCITNFASKLLFMSQSGVFKIHELDPTAIIPNPSVNKVPELFTEVTGDKVIAEYCDVLVTHHIHGFLQTVMKQQRHRYIFDFSTGNLLASDILPISKVTNVVVRNNKPVSLNVFIFTGIGIVTLFMIFVLYRRRSSAAGAGAAGKVIAASSSGMS